MARFNKTRLSIALSLVLMLTATIILQQAASNHDDAKFNIHKTMTALRIEIRDATGNLKETRYKEDDLVLNQYLNFTKGLLMDHVGAAQYITLTDSAGTSRTPKIRDYMELIGCLYSSDGVASNVGGYIGIGTGSTAAARTDYCLQTQVESYTGVSSPTYSDGNVTFSASIAITADRTLYEAGFFCRWIYTGTTLAYFMFFRDVYAAVSVTNGDTATVTYTLDLQTTGFNDNYGKLLAAIFKNVPDTTTTVTLVDTAGSSQTLNVYSGDNEAHVGVFDINTGTPGTGIQVGTSSSAVGRNNSTLGTPVESLTANSAPTWSNGNLTTSVSITMTADRTITEGGFFIKGMNTAGASKTFMLWRDTFTGEAVATGKYITITFTLSH